MSWWDSIVSSPIKDVVAKNVGSIMSDVERAIGIPDEEKDQVTVAETTKEENILEDSLDPPPQSPILQDTPLLPVPDNISKLPPPKDEWEWQEDEASTKPKKLRKTSLSRSKTTKKSPIIQLTTDSDSEQLNEAKKQKTPQNSADSSPVSVSTSKIIENSNETNNTNIKSEIQANKSLEIEETRKSNETDSNTIVQDSDYPKEQPDVEKDHIDWEEKAQQASKEIEELKLQNAKLDKQLQSREAQMESVGTMASLANTENNELKDKLAALYKEHENLKNQTNTKDNDVEELKKEFTTRLGKEQKIISDLKQQIQKLRQTNEQNSNHSPDEDKTQMIEELRQEGIKLSKKQLQLEKIIKQLRIKEKESENVISALTTRAEKAEASAQNHNDKLKEMSYTGKSANETISHLKQLSEANIKKLEKQEQIVKEANSRVVNLEEALEKAWQDLAEQRKINLGKATQAEQSVFEAVASVKEEYNSQIRQIQSESQERENALNQTIEELRNELSNVEAKHFRNEEMLQRELLESQRKYQDLCATETIDHDSEALQSLHREMDAIRASHEANRRVWNSLENVLRTRLQEQEEKTEELLEKERIAHAELNNAAIAYRKIESKLSYEKTSNARILADLDATRGTLEETQRSAEELKAKLEHINQVHDSFKASSQTQISSLEAELKEIRESEKNIRFQFSKQLQEAENKNRVSPATSSFGDSPAPSKKRNFSVIDSNVSLPSGMSSSASFERMQSTMSQQESEIKSLQDQLKRLEATKSSLDEQLVKLTGSNDKYVLELEEFKQIKKANEELQHQHDVLMELYGAKEERVEELREDIQEMKIIYQTQINELLSRIEALTK